MSVEATPFHMVGSKLLIKIIKAYQLIISPYLGNNCRYLPTCSEYAVLSLKKHGIIKEDTLIYTERGSNNNV